VLTADDRRCVTVAQAVRDIGCFVGWVEQRFTPWFNRTRARRRRGTLWADRFKSVPIERAAGLWECLCYIEMNATRAGRSVASACSVTASASKKGRPSASQHDRRAPGGLHRGVPGLPL